jgi:hypothetical protein
MEPGFILDRGRYDSKTVSQRVEGAPDRSFWAGIKINDRDKFQVTTYRRSGCGYLESYALFAQ